MIDPFALKSRSKLDPFRLAWTAYSRAMELYSRARHQPVSAWPCVREAPYVRAERGADLPDTAVTAGQAGLLDMAIQATEGLGCAVLELGSYRGVTTAAIARATRRPVFAVDPYIGYGGWEVDMETMRRRISEFPHVRHVRLASGAAAAQLTAERFSLVFIDAVHDFANTSFDFQCWAPRILPGGLVAMHDVDDFPGTNFALRRILNRQRGFRFWGYCPNMAILEKAADPLPASHGARSASS